MTKLWKFLFLMTWVVILAIIIFLAVALASAQNQTQQQVINQYLTKGSGLSAYEVAVKNGFKGTESQWITSLNGEAGKDSVSKETTVHTESTVIKQVPVNGEDGADGQSSYSLWLSLGNTGTEQDYLDSLKGEPGQTSDYIFRFNADLGLFQSKKTNDTFWKTVATCGGTTGKVCN
jgi:hypothetical protein